MNTRMERLIPDDEYGNEPATTNDPDPRTVVEDLIEALENLLAVSPWSSAEIRNVAHAAIERAKESLS
jgi:hypothetical protein